MLYNKSQIMWKSMMQKTTALSTAEAQCLDTGLDLPQGHMSITNAFIGSITKLENLISVAGNVPILYKAERARSYAIYNG